MVFKEIIIKVHKLKIQINLCLNYSEKTVYTVFFFTDSLYFIPFLHILFIIFSNKLYPVLNILIKFPIISRSEFPEKNLTFTDNKLRFNFFLIT